MQQKSEGPLGGLISQLVYHLIYLIRREIECAKVELNMKAAKTLRYLILIGIGGGLSLAALLVLLSGIVNALTEYFPYLISSIIVSVFFGNIGFLLAGFGIYKLSREDPASRKTAEIAAEGVIVTGKEAA